MNTCFNITKRVLVVVMDGLGMGKPGPSNAVTSAHSPHLNFAFSNFPFATLEAGGESVGLPKGVAGNSEVGHMNLGAGRSVRQDLVRINESISEGSFQDREELKSLISMAKKNSRRVHLMGLLSDGGVHSHIEHLKAIVDSLSATGDLKIFLHAFMDGRDTARDCGERYLDLIKSWPITLASIHGRSIAMDRDRRWEKIQWSYETMIGLKGSKEIDPIEYLKSEYSMGRYDEFIHPLLFSSESAIKPDDCVFFFNFRPDRAIQMTLAMTLPNFKEFSRPVKPSYYLCMTPYVQDDIDLPILFDKEALEGVLCEFLAKKNFKQYKIAETEKYAHVTYFFNGGKRAPFEGEDQKLIPSPKDVATYNLRPEMSAFKVLENLLVAIKDPKYTFLLVNFANPDMVGHTGDFLAAVKAVETVDQCIGKILKECEEEDLAIILTADHGNCDQMKYEDGTPHTSHTNAPVPFALIHPRLKNVQLKLNVEKPSLKDLAPTVLYLLGERPPEIFSGQNIFS